MSKLVVDVEVVWGDKPATSPVPGGEAVVRVERTDPFRSFYAVGWLQPRSRPKAKPILRLVGPDREHEEKEAWADYLALAYVVGRAWLDQESPEEAFEKARRALPVASRAKVERAEATQEKDELDALAEEMFGSGSGQLELVGSGS